MRTPISFVDYLESKKRLKEADENIPKMVKQYKPVKYCKVPLRENKNTEEKNYIPLKPTDRVEILWEFSNLERPTPKTIIIESDKLDDDTMYFIWNDAKVRKWVESTLENID